MATPTHNSGLPFRWNKTPDDAGMKLPDTSVNCEAISQFVESVISSNPGVKEFGFEGRYSTVGCVVGLQPKLQKEGFSVYMAMNQEEMHKFPLPQDCRWHHWQFQLYAVRK